MSYVKKVLLTLGVIVSIFLICGAIILFNAPDDEVNPIYHKEINYPINAQPIAVQCGSQPCVVFYDSDLEAAVALMLDGSTITIKPEVAETNN